MPDQSDPAQPARTINPPGYTVTIIGTQDSLKRLLEELAEWPLDRVLPYGMEGVDDGRTSHLIFVTFYFATKSTVYLVDIMTLGKKAFQLYHRTSLKSILSSPKIRKITFDVKAACKTTFNTYRVAPYNVEGVQLLHAAAATNNMRTLKWLKHCLECDSPFTPISVQRWQRNNHDLWVGDNSHSTNIYRFALFTIRPTREDVQKVCANHLIVLPVLYTYYASGLPPKTRNEVWNETQGIITTLMSTGIGTPGPRNPWFRPEERECPGGLTAAPVVPVEHMVVGAPVFVRGQPPPAPDMDHEQWEFIESVWEDDAVFVSR
ncbi:hypothetical protein BJX70DRAFT_402841 [Aspergillus crustosus]